MERNENETMSKVAGVCIALSVLFCSALTTASSFDYKQYENIDQTRIQTFLPANNIDSTLGPYHVFIHSDLIKNNIYHYYDYEKIKHLEKLTSPVRTLSLIEGKTGTFIEAASFEDKDSASETNYNAIWVRDSLWGYLALQQEKGREQDARKVLLTLWDYMSSPAQITRMRDVIKDPSLIDGPDGQMRAIHIRFDGNSPDFADVYENGHPQPWNHKQNDALGLFLDTLIRAADSGKLIRSDWNRGSRMEAVVLLVAYLNRVRFYEMQDSGAWEEEERLNTSSIALVVSGLERLSEILVSQSDKKVPNFTHDLMSTASDMGMEQYLTSSSLGDMILQGYKRIYLQIGLGGESPDYQKNHVKYREADAALLNLIYPATLTRLTTQHKKQVLDIVRPLAGSYGIRRYFNDNYQSANFWFRDIKTDVSEDTTKKRIEAFIPGTEAQWFFDSWYSMASALVYKETHDIYNYNQSIQFMNRALAQITGDNMLGANGRSVPAMAIPESYNFIMNEGKVVAVPSPIIPLNWAKSSMSLMFKTVTEMIESPK